MARVRLLHCLQHDIIKESAIAISQGQDVKEATFIVPVADGETPALWWDEEADKSLVMGVFKHGKFIL